MQDNKFSRDENQKPAGAPRTGADEELHQYETGLAPSVDGVAGKACINNLNQGSLPGYALQHWLEAGAQLLAERNLHSASSVPEPEARHNSQSSFHERADLARNSQLLDGLIIVRDLTKEAPHSPRERLAGFAIASRAVDKCLASLAGMPGEYHYDCPLDKSLFSFKGITGDQFKTAVQAATSYADIGAWLQANGIAKTPVEIKTWSEGMEGSSPMKNPEKRDEFMENCSMLGLNPETSTLFDLLDEDDRTSFAPKSAKHPISFPFEDS